MRASSYKRWRLGWVSWLVAAVFVSSAMAQHPPKKRGVKVAAIAPIREAKLGSYYALVIGIRNYQNFTPLSTPINDAKEVAAVLHDQYGFKTQLLLDATRDQILDALGHYRIEMQEDDNLLIYYAGHGYFDNKSDLAYWYPAEAGKASTARWINASEITGQARAIPARHVLVIADSCYSGMIARGVTPTVDVPQERQAYLKTLIQRKSRHVMASGGNEPVADQDSAGHPGGHSVFANALLQGLREFRDEEYSAEELFNQYIREQVAGRSKQLPEYDAIRDSDHDGGGFVFVRSQGLPAPSIQDVIVPAKKVDLIEIQPETPPHTVRLEGDVITAALHRYEDAYGSMDIDLLKAVWPSLSKTQIDGLKAGFRGAQAVKVQIQQCDVPSTHDDIASVRCEQSMVYTRDGRRQLPKAVPVEISLRKTPGGEWVVADVRAR